MYAIINLEGRLVADPEFRVGKEDREYCTLRLAVNQKLGPQENATFYNCTGNEYIAKRLRKSELAKGQPLQVVGNLTVREYTWDWNENTFSSPVATPEFSKFADILSAAF